jgi:hypothetical protein
MVSLEPRPAPPLRSIHAAAELSAAAQGDRTVKILLAATLSALTAVSASANCGTTKNPSPAAYQSAMQSFQRMQARLSAQPAQAAAEPRATAPTIVGLWHSVLLADPKGGYNTAGPNVIDEGFEIWHADGTEVLNDISAPVTGNVCFGVWSQTGPLTYQLKHPTWIFDETSTQVIGIGTIAEQVTLDANGNSFSGTSTFDILDLTGANIVHFSAAVLGERINSDGQLYQPTPPSGVITTAVVTPASLTTSQHSITLDGSGSTGVGALTYLYSVVPGGKVPAILQTPNNPKATIQFVSGPGTYTVQLKVTDSTGKSAMSPPVVIVYTAS